MKMIDLKVVTRVEHVHPCEVPDDFDFETATDEQLMDLVEESHCKRYWLDETEPEIHDVDIMKD